MGFFGSTIPSWIVRCDQYRTPTLGRGDAAPHDPPTLSTTASLSTRRSDGHWPSRGTGGRD